MDIDALLGLDTNADPQRMRTIADTLRGQQRSGDLLSLSQIGPVRQMGQQQSQRATQAAGALGRLRDSAAARQARQQEREMGSGRIFGMTEYENPETGEIRFMGTNEFGQFVTPEGERVSPEGFTKRKTLSANKAYDIKNLGVKERKELQEVIGDTAEFEAVADEFKPEYGGSGFGPTGSISGWLADNVHSVASDDMREKNNWFKKFDRVYTLPTRNAMFGGALTAGEAQAWKAANITRNSHPEDIQRALGEILQIKQNVENRLRNQYGAMPGSGGERMMDAIGARDTSPLSADEQADLERLKKKYGIE